MSCNIIQKYKKILWVVLFTLYFSTSNLSCSYDWSINLLYIYLFIFLIYNFQVQGPIRNPGIISDTLIVKSHNQKLGPEVVTANHRIQESCI